MYRRDNDDATHSHQFMQIEGLVVDRKISMSDLKGTLELVAKNVRKIVKSGSVRAFPIHRAFCRGGCDLL